MTIVGAIPNHVGAISLTIVGANSLTIVGAIPKHVGAISLTIVGAIPNRVGAISLTLVGAILLTRVGAILLAIGAIPLGIVRAITLTGVGAVRRARCAIFAARPTAACGTFVRLRSSKARLTHDLDSALPARAVRHIARGRCASLLATYLLAAFRLTPAARAGSDASHGARLQAAGPD